MKLEGAAFTLTPLGFRRLCSYPSAARRYREFHQLMWQNYPCGGSHIFGGDVRDTGKLESTAWTGVETSEGLTLYQACVSSNRLAASSPTFSEEPTTCFKKS